MKVSIVYFSQTGTTETAAEFIQDGILAKFPFMEIKEALNKSPKSSKVLRAGQDRLSK